MSKPEVRIIPPGAELDWHMPVAAMRPGDVWAQASDEVEITEVGPPVWDTEISKTMVTFKGRIRKGWGAGRTIHTWTFPVEQTLSVYREQAHG